MKNMEGIYKKRIDRYAKLHKKQSRIAGIISNLRLGVFITGAILVVSLYTLEYFYLCAAILIAALTIFVHLIAKHQGFLDRMEYSRVIGMLNEKCRDRLNGKWTCFDDTGSDFLEESHSYSYDLDIFGQGSLFQLVNTAVTFCGRRKLAEMLAKRCRTVDEIRLRQESVVELAGKLRWRQRFASEAYMLPQKYKIADPKPLFAWACERNRFYENPSLILLLRALPAATAILSILSFGFSLLSPFIPVAGLVIQFLLLRWDKKHRNEALGTAWKFRRDVKVYEKMLRWFEKEPFQTELLKNLKDKLLNTHRQTAGQQVRKLEQIINAITNRNNAFYFFMNIVTLWDYQCMFSFEKWKRESSGLLESWLAVLGEVEALSSLAQLNFDHTDWCIPHVMEGQPSLKARNLGHPLLTEHRVCNDLTFYPPVNVYLVTGSNMSGKSTFLRTAGINLVLAYAGAAVCAASFQCSLMDIHTCMRVSDSLEKNISSFYAEILRIKRIVEAVEAGEKVFFLLDEIFKGTNSRDRHTGAKILIKKLSSKAVLGLVSTHDLELAELEKECPRIGNCHFREYYENNEIRFDYKLRPGVSTTRNAVYLMRMAGIEVE